MSNTPAEQIVWIDCEMTGLDIDRDGLCELAIIVTDFDLTPLDPGLSIVINPGSDALDGMSDFVRNMHVGSGLLPQIASGATPEDAETEALAYLERFVDAARRPLVGGNTIGMDRRFISKYLPRLDERLHYRSIDVSTIKELSRRWHAPSFSAAPVKHGGHRALADIAESIRELAFFRDTVMLPSPGPTREQANERAAHVRERFAALIDPQSGE